jgi:hypothetical protein
VFPFRSLIESRFPVAPENVLFSPFLKVSVQVVPSNDSEASALAGVITRYTRGDCPEKPKLQMVPSPREYFINPSLPRETLSS